LHMLTANFVFLIVNPLKFQCTSINKLIFTLLVSM